MKNDKVFGNMQECHMSSGSQLFRDTVRDISDISQDRCLQHTFESAYLRNVRCSCCIQNRKMSAILPAEALYHALDARDVVVR
jgi:hypothetical protein